MLVAIGLALVIAAGCVLLLIMSYAPATLTPRQCSLFNLGVCSASEYNALCAPFVEHGLSPECEAQCDVLASLAPESVAAHTFCLRLSRYKHYSTCDSPATFSDTACVTREWEAYCAGATGTALCNEYCAMARDAAVGGVAPNSWDIDTYCDHPFCPAPDTDRGLCGGCHRTRDVGSAACRAESEQTRRVFCYQYLAQEPCRDYCNSDPRAVDDPLCIV